MFVSPGLSFPLRTLFSPRCLVTRALVFLSSLHSEFVPFNLYRKKVTIHGFACEKTHQSHTFRSHCVLTRRPKTEEICRCVDRTVLCLNSLILKFVCLFVALLGRKRFVHIVHLECPSAEGRILVFSEFSLRLLTEPLSVLTNYQNICLCRRQQQYPPHREFFPTQFNQYRKFICIR